MKALKRILTGVLLLGGIVAVGILTLWVVTITMEGETSYIEEFSRVKPLGINEKAIRQECARHIIAAEKEAQQAIQKRADEFRRYLVASKAGSRLFAEDIVSMRGKWRAVKPYLPFTDKDGHKEYVKEKFDLHIFSEAQLAGALRRTIEHIACDLDAIENDLALKIRAEILGRSVMPDEIPIARSDFEKSVAMVIKASQKDALVGSVRFITAETTSIILTHVTVRLLVSLGYLSAGAASMPYTFGIGLAIGIMVDTAYSMITDPAGAIEKEINAAIDAMAVNGSEAIRSEIKEIITARSNGWKHAVDQLIANR